MNALEYITKTLAFFDEDPDRWISGRLAQDALGLGCSADSPGAVGWCAIGGLCKTAKVSSAITAPPSLMQAMDALNDAVIKHEQTGEYEGLDLDLDLAWFNDSKKSWAEVRPVFLDAIIDLRHNRSAA